MVNKISFLLLMLCLSIGNAQDFTVNNYTVDITIHKEGYFDVVENYDLNFDVPKHGIYRTIQTKYELEDSTGTTSSRKIKIANIKVPNHKFDKPFDFVQKLQDQMEIKIGDKDINVIGPQHYKISYRVYNAFIFTDSQIKFYWNIKPEGWSANFQQINFTIHVPQDVYLSRENSFVYSGDTGTTGQSKTIQTYFANGEFSGASKSDFISYPGQSVTVLINLPLGAVAEYKPFWPFWTDYGFVFLIGILIAAFIWVWWIFGKDERVIATTTYYPPDHIDPALAGFLINDREDNSDLVSLFPYWGEKGLIRLEEIPKKGLFGSKDTKIIKLNPLPMEATVYEREIFSGLFNDSTSTETEEVLVSSLKNTFYTNMDTARELLKENAQPYYEGESKKVQGILYVILILLAIGLTAIGLFMWGPIGAITMIISCVVLIYVNKFMVKKNEKGNRLFSELKGFKRFIKVAEEHKLEMLLKEDPHYFESTMGYALAFGMFNKWSKKFDGLDIPPPTWYTGHSGANVKSFSRSFSSSMDKAKSNMVSSPSNSGSSGGGSSGGGFGGGGGGSW
ncbi:hypothetical protein KCTC52924_03301 [Arenibacter antarcticus]|uniref:DUF2207 domain-containing protein n=1 Tax=Arenibacter antarcticus TaxID=2040469 RepID=A0ABW5VG11_9FLAO|nr:DUF2207 domain-containing protein [Arenibacter sp. H213]MCM4166368.1 DUF2207 domain-containing protein [Arenibacter sp. H213]